MRPSTLWTSLLASLILFGDALATSPKCSQFFANSDGSAPSTVDISSHLVGKSCKADASLMTLFNSQVGRNIFEALTMTRTGGAGVDSCNAFVALLSFAVTNNWLEELCATGPLNSPGGGEERNYCRDSSLHSQRLGSAIQALDTDPRLEGLSSVSKAIKSFTDNPQTCQVTCGSFLDAALCDGFVNIVSFIATKLRNGAEFKNVPSFDTSAFDALKVGQLSASETSAQRLFMYWWFVSNGYRPSQDLGQHADIQTEYDRFVTWKKQQEAQTTIVTLPQPEGNTAAAVQHVSKRGATSRSEARRDASGSKD